MRKVQDRRMEPSSKWPSDPPWIHYLTYQGDAGYHWFCVTPEDVYYALVDHLEPNGGDEAPDSFNIMMSWHIREQRFIPPEGPTAYLARLQTCPEVVILEITL